MDILPPPQRPEWDDTPLPFPDEAVWVWALLVLLSLAVFATRSRLRER